MTLYLKLSVISWFSMLSPFRSVSHSGPDSSPPHLPSSWKTPPVTSLKEVKTAPSCWREVEWGGMEPGVMPPMSAWCPLLATKNTGPLTPFLNTWTRKKKGNEERIEEEFEGRNSVEKCGGLTGVITVRSGRWLPPADGWLLKITSPSLSLFPSDLSCSQKKKNNILLSFNVYGHTKKNSLTHGWTVRASPGTGQSPAWLPGGRGCEVRWTPDLHPVQTQHRRSQVAPWCSWRWRFFAELCPSAL